MTTIYYTATSLDGFLATQDDDVSWLDQLPQPTQDTYTPFIETVGALIMGRATYEFLLRHLEGGGQWPYPDHPCFVVTHQAFEPRDKVVFVAGDAPNVHAQAQKAAKGKAIWIVGGGDLAGQFLEAGLLDELVITVASTTLAAGKPLLPRQASFELISARMLGPGFAQLHYRV